MEATHRNNFDFLRLVAASLVLFSHEFSFTGGTETTLLPGLTGGKMGVYIFFTISGYLVTESWTRDPHLIRFVLKRILRIWPGLIATTFLATFIIGPWVTQLSLKDYFTDPLFFRYFNTLRLEISFFLPGVFEKSIYPKSVNGSLWTIPIEVICYLILLAFGACRITKISTLFIFLNIFIGFLSFNLHLVTQDYFNLVDLGLFFFYGVCLSTGSRYWKNAPKSILAACLITSSAYYYFGLYPLAIWMTLPYLVILIGTSSTPWIRNAGKYGDFSYGIYIYAFPIQQTVAHFLGNAMGFASQLTLSYAVTLVLSCLSWHFIERPALRLKPHPSQPGPSLASDTPGGPVVDTPNLLRK